MRNATVGQEKNIKSVADANLSAILKLFQAYLIGLNSGVDRFI